jgi:hypothetical protein
MNRGLEGQIKSKQDLSIALQLGVPRAWLLANTNGVIYRSWGINSIVSGAAGICTVNLPFRTGGIKSMTMMVGSVSNAGYAIVYNVSAKSVGVNKYNTAGTLTDHDFFLVIYGA